MPESRERAIKAVSVPMSSGAGMSPSMGVAAPIGAVSRRQRRLAQRTSLRREGDSTLLLRTAIPGRVLLQRRASDGDWETARTVRASRLRRTRLDLADAGCPAGQQVRVVFSPKNSNITSWVSPPIDV